MTSVGLTCRRIVCARLDQPLSLFPLLWSATVERPMSEERSGRRGECDLLLRLPIPYGVDRREGGGGKFLPPPPLVQVRDETRTSGRGEARHSDMLHKLDGSIRSPAC